MVERTNERPKGKFFEAANFLRESLRSHKATGNIIEVLSKDPEGFGSDFARAETPREVLSAVSRSGSLEQRRHVALVVDRWVNAGHQRNVSVIGQIIRRDYLRWIETLEITSD